MDEDDDTEKDQKRVRSNLGEEEEMKYPIEEEVKYPIEEEEEEKDEVFDEEQTQLNDLLENEINDYKLGEEEEHHSRSSLPTTSTTEPIFVPQFHFSGSKAGMESVDKARVERIVQEVSQGNPYYEKAKRDEEKIRERALQLKAKKLLLTNKDISVAEIEVSKKIKLFEKTRDLSRICVVIDMDQFFVAVEMRDNPSLKGKPVGVGTTLIGTSSYEARKFGVRSAMPTFIGKKLCPNLIMVPGRMSAYAEASKCAQSIFSEYDPNFSAMSLDEAYLDITSLMKGLTLNTKEGIDLANSIVQELREKVSSVTGGLTCSAGIASNHMLAKICSEKNKPNGQYVLNSDLAITFIRSLPIRKIPGIGKASEITLDVAFGIKTVQDLWDNRLLINRTMTPALIDFYLRIPLCATTTTSNTHGSIGHFGFTDSKTDFYQEEIDRKSISIERTFRATNDELFLKEKLKSVCEELSKEISEKNIYGKTITLKLKTDLFDVTNHGTTQKQLIGGKEITSLFLYRIIEPIFNSQLPKCLRLIGVRLSNLSTIKNSSSLMSIYRQSTIQENLDHSGESNLKEENFCPICSRSFLLLKCFKNEEINSHIDSCLNGDVVSVLVREDNEIVIQKNLKENKTIESYFSRN